DIALDHRKETPRKPYVCVSAALWLKIGFEKCESSLSPGYLWLMRWSIYGVIPSCFSRVGGRRVSLHFEDDYGHVIELGHIAGPLAHPGHDVSHQLLG